MRGARSARGRIARSGAAGWIGMVGWVLFGLVVAAAQGAEGSAEDPLPADRSPRALFEAGNAAYEARDYERAISCYEAVIDAGLDDGFVYYNLGNAYYKAGDLGRAILAYRRAERRIPRFDDLRENLAYLEVLRRDRVEEEGASPLVERIDRWIHSVTVEELARAVLVLWLGIGALAVAHRLARSERRRRALVRALGAAGIAFALGVAHVAYLAAEYARDRGIVVAEEVAVRSGPDPEYVTECELHAGTEVEIRRVNGEWVQVALSESLKGWCPRSAVEPI